MQVSEFIALARQNRAQLERLGIVSFVIGGSVGRGTDDSFSDIDAFLVARADDFDQIRHTMPTIAEVFGSVLLFRSGALVPNYGSSFTALYKDFGIVQFNLNSADALHPNALAKHRYIEVFDSGAYSNYRTRSLTIELDPRELFLRANCFFWLRAIMAARMLFRGELYAAIKYIQDLRDQSLLIARLLNHAPPLDPAAPAKQFNADLDESTAPPNMIDLPAEDTPARRVRAFLLQQVEWFSDASESVAGRLGLEEHNDLASSRIAKARIIAELTSQAEI